METDRVRKAEADFAPTASQRLEALGNRISSGRGDVGMAAIRVRVVEMRKLGTQAREAAAMLRIRPKLRDQIAKMRASGALPHFRG